MNTKNIFLLCLWLFTTCLLQAQDKMPQAISYQAVARDTQGKVVSEKSIGVKVEILRGSENGNVVFSETHKPTSSRTGTVNLLIGQGVSENGSFASIDWGADTYFLQLSMDLAGGDNYQKVSTTQMLPVPYALYAAKAGEVENGGNSGSSEKVPKFLITPVDYGGDLFDIMAGEVEFSLDEYESYGISIDCAILYLDGIDQHLTITIEGSPEGSYFGSAYTTISKSSFMGRKFELDYFVPKVDLPYDKTKLVIKNEETGEIVKEVPFKLVQREN